MGGYFKIKTYPLVYPLSPNPYLTDDKEVFSFHNALLDFLLDPFPDFLLVLVHIGTVEVAVPGIDGSRHRRCHLPWLRLK